MYQVRIPNQVATHHLILLKLTHLVKITKKIPSSRFQFLTNADISQGIGHQEAFIASEIIMGLRNPDYNNKGGNGAHSPHSIC